jgi:hypothetical protein
MVIDPDPQIDLEPAEILVPWYKAFLLILGGCRMPNAK